MGRKKRKKSFVNRAEKARLIDESQKTTTQAYKANQPQVDDVNISPVDTLESPTIWKSSSLLAITVIVFAGIIAFMSGLRNPFLLDDFPQIVNNPIVQSLSNIKTFFEGSTFYNEDTPGMLYGTYYRPLMTTAFSIIYTIFGTQTWAYHLFQMFLCIVNASLIYLLFRRFFNNALALVLALIFLLHPINSQVAFAIPSLQDPLYLFFGLTALLIVSKYNSLKSIIVAVIFLFLALLSKEAGWYFVIMTGLYIAVFNRNRLKAYLISAFLPLAIYNILKINAVGFSSDTSIAPIGNANLIERLLTAPSIIAHYLQLLIFPLNLSSGNYWIHEKFNILDVLLPLFIIILIIIFLLRVGLKLRKSADKDYYKAFIFFGSWTVIGLVPYLQIVPLTMTFAENWFYFSTAGVLGMVGIIIIVNQRRIRKEWFFIIVSIVIVTFGVRTALRGNDWNSAYSLAVSDVKVSKENYVAYQAIAFKAFGEGNYTLAKTNILKSIDIYPLSDNYRAYGLILVKLQDYEEAKRAYLRSLEFNDVFKQSSTYGGLCQLLLVYGNNADNIRLIENLSSNRSPENTNLKICLALLHRQGGDNVSAKNAIIDARTFGDVPNEIYKGIYNNQTFNMFFPDTEKTLVFKSTM